jgi:hypothetical protein
MTDETSPGTDDDSNRTDDSTAPADAGEALDDLDDLLDSEAAARLATRFGFDDEQAQMFMMLTGAASLFAEEGDPALGDDDAERSNAIALFVRALDDATVALAAWDAWAEEGLTGDKLQPFVDEIVAQVTGDQPGVSWLRSRQAALRLDHDESTRLLEAVRDSGHAAVLIDLAGLQADGSNPIEARDLLAAAGVTTDIDLDAAYDPLTSEQGLGAELAEEIAPFAALRPKPLAGRNDTCPCGSAKKYKHCHLGKELHSLNDRAAWLYLKMMRFMQLTNPFLPDAVVAEMTSSLETTELAEMLESSYIPTDIALHEGDVATRFLTAKSAVLPADEIELAEQWIAAPRSVFRVKKSTHAELELVELRSRDRVTIVGTVPEQPLEVGTLICGRPLPVGSTHRSYGGFLPVDETMIDGVLEACASRNLETVAISLSQIFDAAEMADAMLAEMGVEHDSTE